MLREVPPINYSALAAVLPVTMQSLSTLEITLSSLFINHTHLRAVLLVCPESMLSDTRKRLRKLSFDATLGEHPDLFLHPRMDSIRPSFAVLLAASQAKADQLLILDEYGLRDFDEHTRQLLLNPPSIGLPTGPTGFMVLPHNITRIIPTNVPQPAAYLVPPFVISTSLVTGFVEGSNDLDVWPSLGEYVAQSRFDMIGGVADTLGMVSSEHDQRLESPALSGELPTVHAKLPASHTTGTFGFAFPSQDDLWNISPVICKLQEAGHSVKVLLYNATSTYSNDDSPEGNTRGSISAAGCMINFSTLTDVIHGFADWLDSLDNVPQVIVALNQQDFFSVTLALELQKPPYLDTTLVRLPRGDLQHSAWMASLTFEEWQYWNVPEITITVITNNRPRSLERLLSSLRNARYFGDNVGLRINLEQTADIGTLRLVQDFNWEHGGVFVHHRVIHGGLLPAVVESWYPHSNDSYGLLLEDDIEVSPLFHAWAKMTVLRYSNISTQLFGVSLYQQKNVELNPEGRRPFNPRTLFAAHGLPEPSTPYLSQIPCSWGAIYFPQHWREFHDYLAVRLSEYTMNIHEDIVPNVRSNKWTKSWKKYFIELAYLRGYVMLYPNYDNFISLSTNHLEVGSHVKDQPEDVYLRKRELFLLPLMPLASESASTAPIPDLLHLPDGTLPGWNALPVLNLTGSMSSVDVLMQQGNERRAELTHCCRATSLPYDVLDLMCLDDVPS
ncbi:hypothetical protein BV22DRAFT_1024105 [Leucogyrophana mollusca]|uniref:Uncharacterized protein n=1 Tax=Leucogyrophana mollusca TaxID=85980 RepID=A0ACB8AZZ0_9AGAM|nr:hypothetical protein BV22DRAFT_1024105 [Leucogyrophana mollusca]